MGDGVKPGIFAIWFYPTERIADGLRSEQNPHDLTAVLIMLEDFLTDELTLPVAIGASTSARA